MSTTGMMNYFSEYTGTINARQRKWLLESLSLVADADSLNGLWFKYLRAQGYLGALPDMMKKWAGDESGNNSISLPDRINSLPLGGATGPSRLFTDGEQGVWYDPSDLSTLFQDAAGTIPVTAAGQPVGLMLDKSGRGNHARQPTAASRPMLLQNATTGAYYLETDGSDDWMSTSAIDFTGTDKVTVMTGVRKLSDAASGELLMLGSSTSAQGFFEVLAPNDPGTPKLLFRSRGSLTAPVEITGVAAPVSFVATMRAEISAPDLSIRLNGAFAGQATATQGTGNYGNHPLYLFRRGGTTLPFNGHFYGLVITGRLTTATETDSVERLLARNTGVVLP